MQARILGVAFVLVVVPMVAGCTALDTATGAFGSVLRPVAAVSGQTLRTSVEFVAANPGQ